MIDYATIPHIVGAFPAVAAVNASGGGATDGTPLLKAVVDDLWGFYQALLNHAGLTPNAATEAASTTPASADSSQKLKSLQKVSGYPGEIVAWAGADNDTDFADDPPGYDWSDPSARGIRLLPCTGQGILRANYLDLDRAVYCGDSHNAAYICFYHADDAAGTIRNAAGIYLILPDLRGQFLRGIDIAGSVDPAGPFRYPGYLQSDGFEAHIHKIDEWFSGAPSAVETYNATLQAGAVSVATWSPIPTGNYLRANDILSGTYSTETRPVNASFTFCIRY